MATRQYLVVANWKMNGSLNRIRQFADELKKGLAEKTDVAVVVCPPFVYLPELAEQLQRTNIEIGAQNVSQWENGAYTGEVSAAMLVDFACRYVLIGHSERRRLFLETDQCVANKLIAVQSENMIPILCVGESSKERIANKTKETITRQLDTVIHTTGIAAFKAAVIAYEPVWAIGTGKTATPEQAEEIHQLIREQLAKHDHKLAQTIQILYGGSIKPDNAKQLFNITDIDGGLIGGASLIADDFLAICRSMR